MDSIMKMIECGYIHEFTINTANSIEDMKKFHNWIKMKLINTTSTLISTTSLLDIAVGRGGDLFKWRNFKIVVGFDNDYLSLNGSLKKGNNFDGAIARLQQQLNRKIKLPFIKFFCLNVLDRDISNKLELLENKFIRNHNNKYSVVSCQFAFHYFAKTQEDLEHTLSFISNKLVDGGIFIGTAPDGDLIQNILKNEDVDLPLMKIKKIDEFSYSFNLVSEIIKNTSYFDVKGESIEFYLYKEQLINSAKKYNLELLEIKSFYDHYKEYNKTINNQELMISFLFFSFIFKKVI